MPPVRVGHPSPPVPRRMVAIWSQFRTAVARPDVWQRPGQRPMDRLRKSLEHQILCLVLQRSVLCGRQSPRPISTHAVPQRAAGRGRSCGPAPKLMSQHEELVEAALAGGPAGLDLVDGLADGVVDGGPGPVGRVRGRAGWTARSVLGQPEGVEVETVALPRPSVRRVRGPIGVVPTPRPPLEALRAAQPGHQSRFDLKFIQPLQGSRGRYRRVVMRPPRLGRILTWGWLSWEARPLGRALRFDLLEWLMSPEITASSMTTAPARLPALWRPP
jgi:hypothetical protein